MFVVNNVIYFLLVVWLLLVVSVCIGVLLLPRYLLLCLLGLTMSGVRLLCSGLFWFDLIWVLCFVWLLCGLV